MPHLVKRVRLAKSDVQYIRTASGNCVLHCGDHRYLRNASYKDKVYWKCSKWRKQCRSRIITHVLPSGQSRYDISGVHNHQ
ncbi:modifier of mdg4-like [Drosophila madeirensis]|uniref:Modifier of mdg4-like n=2 Tax=obscura subgroup TaxID=32357 RepID=A0AAU9EXF4_DROMD